MKKKLFSVLLAGSLSLVQAQPAPVTVYGLLDAGVISVNHTGTQNKTATFMSSGGLYTSRWGIKGAEDLGGGNSAGFVLEGNLSLRDGSTVSSSSTGSAANIFARHAKVYLSNNDLGRVTIGRQFNSLYDAWVKVDARKAQNFGTGQTYWGDGSAFNGTATSKTGISSFTGGNQWNSAIRYESPKMGGLIITGQYAPGGVAGDMTANSRYALDGVYTAGPVELVAGGLAIYNSTGNQISKMFLGGATYTFDVNKLATYYVTMKNPSTPNALNSDFTLYSVTGKRALSPMVDLTLGYYNFKDNITTANKSQMLSAGIDYNLTKRTTFYAAVSQVDNRGSFGFAPVAGGNLNSLATTSTNSTPVSTAGQKHLATTAGIIHRF